MDLDKDGKISRADLRQFCEGQHLLLSVQVFVASVQPGLAWRVFGFRWFLGCEGETPRNHPRACNCKSKFKQKLMEQELDLIFADGIKDRVLINETQRQLPLSAREIWQTCTLPPSKTGPQLLSTALCPEQSASPLSPAELSPHLHTCGLYHPVQWHCQLIQTFRESRTDRLMIETGDFQASFQIAAAWTRERVGLWCHAPPEH